MPVMCRILLTAKVAIVTAAGTASDATEAGPIGQEQARPAVSVVVPCFNGGRFLDGLMASLVRQTFRDFEIIIVDDGSKDEETRRKLAALEQQAHVIHQDNRGPSAARNVGIREARADIVFTMDCDDTIEPTFLAETVPVLRAAPADVAAVFTDIRLVGAESGVLPRYFNRFDLLFTNPLSSGLVLRKESWRVAGGFDESMREGYEDWDFSLRLARAGFRGIEVRKPLYIYFIAEDAVDPSRSSAVRNKRLYGQLWRLIRGKHPECYGPLVILRTWRATRDGTSRVPLWKGLAAYLLALVLPDSWFSLLVDRLHQQGLWRVVREPPGNDELPRRAILSEKS
jgi:glycosyltransferase involved in cell wall biosynthesis